MPDYLLVTVDCDLRAGDISLRQASLERLLEVFAAHGVAGHATWFLNENDFALTENHPTFLREVVRRGDTVGVHDHYEPFQGLYAAEPIQAFCARSKASVERWLAAEGYPDPVIYHRNGCLVQHPEVYGALHNLGYAVVSEVYPGHALPDRSGYPAFDNRALPCGILPYYHDASNYDAFESTRGCFLHFPIMHMGLADLDWGTVAQWKEAFARRAVGDRMYVWLFHPYEIMNRERTGLADEAVQRLVASLGRFSDEYGMIFWSLAEGRAHLPRAV